LKNQLSPKLKVLAISIAGGILSGGIFCLTLRTSTGWSIAWAILGGAMVAVDSSVNDAMRSFKVGLPVGLMTVVSSSAVLLPYIVMVWLSETQLVTTGWAGFGKILLPWLGLLLRFLISEETLYYGLLYRFSEAPGWGES